MIPQGSVRKRKGSASPGKAAQASNKISPASHVPNVVPLPSGEGRQAECRGQITPGKNTHFYTALHTFTHFGSQSSEGKQVKATSCVPDPLAIFAWGALEGFEDFVEEIDLADEGDGLADVPLLVEEGVQSMIEKMLLALAVRQIAHSQNGERCKTRHAPDRTHQLTSGVFRVIQVQEQEGGEREKLPVCERVLAFEVAESFARAGQHADGIGDAALGQGKFEKKHSIGIVLN
jgi:hypothetical protein